MPKIKKVTKEYVNNQEFLNLLIKYRQTGDKRVYNMLGTYFLKIAHGMSNRPNFIGYSYDRKSAMISDATFFMSKYVNKYDVTKTNPFAYFSQICFNAFIQAINKETRLAKDFVNVSFIENMDRDDYVF